MDILETIQIRRSIRSYLERPVEQEKLSRVLEAGRLSPSAANLQPCDFILVQETAAKTRLSLAYNRSWFSKAPAIIAVCATPAKGWRRSDGEEFWKIDAAIAMQTMVLAATAEGLGTCWIGAFDEEKAKAALDVPQGVRVVAMTPIGYPAEMPAQPMIRKSLSEILHWDHW